jgi:hypothetical protein
VAAGDRSDQIKDKVRLITGVDNARVPDSQIFVYIDEAQRYICEEVLCLEVSASLAIVSGTSTYDMPAGFYRLKSLNLTSTKLIPIREVDQEELNYLKKNYVGFAGQTPSWFSIFGYDASMNQQIEFYPTPNANETYTVKYYAIPSTNATTLIDPETPARFDVLIEFRIMATLFPIQSKFQEATYYWGLFYDELKRAKSSWRRTKTQILDIYPSE